MRNFFLDNVKKLPTLVCGIVISEGKKGDYNMEIREALGMTMATMEEMSKITFTVEKDYPQGKNREWVSLTTDLSGPAPAF
ncbi:MAG: hypothetical protein LBI56_02055 [Puniceicoccales bacterium]|jgi:hypothetical protein|nr:hypothetical protein [Puniceicoccales bacterium]